MRISIHALLAESDPHLPMAPVAQDISIHALLAESDHDRQGLGQTVQISIHALLAESDQLTPKTTPPKPQFLSTLSLRRATGTVSAPDIPKEQFLSTLSLRRATSALGGTTMLDVYFYPRSPCGERRAIACMVFCYFLFLSTLSLRRATNGHETTPYIAGISIHALLAESDSMLISLYCGC